MKGCRDMLWTGNNAPKYAAEVNRTMQRAAPAGRAWCTVTPAAWQHERGLGSQAAAVQHSTAALPAAWAAEAARHPPASIVTAHWPTRQRVQLVQQRCHCRVTSSGRPQIPPLTKCTCSAGASAAEVLQGGLPAPASFAPPAKSLMNLATTVDSLAFSPDQQVMMPAPHPEPVDFRRRIGTTADPCDVMLAYASRLLRSSFDVVAP